MRWERKISLTLAVVVVLFCAAGAPSAKAQAKKPNVVFILVDNVGWGDFQVYGGTVPTPRIDKLASEGIRFNNYNVALSRQRRTRKLAVRVCGERVCVVRVWPFVLDFLRQDVHRL